MFPGYINANSSDMNLDSFLFLRKDMMDITDNSPIYKSWEVDLHNSVEIYFDCVTWTRNLFYMRDTSGFDQ